MQKIIYNEIMKFKTMATIASVLIFFNATFFLLAPEFSLNLLGRSTNISGQLMMRISGACALGLAVILWSARNTRSSEVEHIVLLGNLVVFCLMVILDLFGLLTGAVSSMGWFLFAADALLLLGFLIAFFTDGGHRS
jgi:hypothetical protein